MQFVAPLTLASKNEVVLLLLAPRHPLDLAPTDDVPAAHGPQVLLLVPALKLRGGQLEQSDIVVFQMVPATQGVQAAAPASDIS
jgi:hypothetical protein